MITKNQLDFLLRNLFRKRENTMKIAFILTHSGLTYSHLKKASTLTRKNPYHNFGHALAVTEYVIKLAIAAGCTKAEINLLAFATLNHDDGHSGMFHWYDEMRSAKIMRKNTTPCDTQVIGKNHAKILDKMEVLIIATTFNRRGKSRSKLGKIIQDADLANIGQGIYYWLWSSMGLIDEFKNEKRYRNLTSKIFIYQIQEEFVNYLATVSKTGKVYLSDSAQKIFHDPLKDIKKLMKLPYSAIKYAYRVRKKDITLNEFTLRIKELVKK